MDLLEREFHLDALDGYLRQAAAGGGNMVLIGGEAGADKTSLIHRFAARAREKPVRVLIGACDAMSTPRPLGPLFDVASDLGRPVRQLLGEHQRRAELFGAVLGSLTAGGPVLFAVEDAHWADEATLDLLKFLGRRIESTRTLLIVTYRDDEVTSRHPFQAVLGDLATRQSVRRLKIDLLSEHAVHILADGAGIDAVELYRKTDGNPFYVTEVIGAGNGAIPPTVRDAVLARYALLSPGGRAALDAAAVIGGRIEPWLLANIVSETAAAVDECLDGGLLQARDNVLQFRHQLARDAVVDAMSPVKRMALHASVLAALRQRVTTVGDYTRLAHHADAAGEAEAVLEFAPAAAARASGLAAHREAAAQFTRALRYADSLPMVERAELLSGWMNESYVTGMLPDAFLASQELLAIARAMNDRVKEAYCLCRQAQLLIIDGRNTEAEAASQSALEILETQPPEPTHALAYVTQAALRMLNRDNADAVVWGERATELARRFDDTEMLVRAMNAVGSSRLVGGDERRGRADLEEGLAIAREAGLDANVASLLTNLGSGYGEIYMVEHADRFLREGLDFTLERDLDGWRWYIVAWLAIVRHLQGRWSEATDLAESVGRIPTADAIARMMALVALGRVRVRRGDPESGTILDEALVLAGPTGTLQRLAPVHTARAEAAWLAGDVATSAAEARVPYELALKHNHSWFLGELAYWQWKSGALTEPPADAAEPYALQMSGNWAGAAAAWTALGCPYEAARALAESDDQEALRRAFATFDRLGARPAAAMVIQRLRALGSESIPRGARTATRANPAHLTSREAEVLALVAEDRTNAEIAARLYLSPKTIEHHVSSILAKLDVRTRREAVRKSSELNLLGQYKGQRPPN